MIITSPPYFNAREYSKYKTYTDYLNFMEEVISLFPKILIEGGYFCLNTTTITEKGVLYPIPFDLLQRCRKYGFNLKWDIIWLKPKYTQALWRSSDYNYKNPYPFSLYLNCFHEYVWIFKLRDKDRPLDQVLLEKSKIVGEKAEIKGKMKDQKILQYSYREWDMEVATPSKEGHSAAFPIELPQNCIELFSLKNDTILDPFLGTGTTSKAALNLGRNSIGIESEKKYFNLIKRKLIPDQKKVFEFYSEDAKQKQNVIKHTIRFKNINFNGKEQFEVYTKIN